MEKKKNSNITFVHEKKGKAAFKKFLKLISTLLKLNCPTKLVLIFLLHTYVNNISYQ